MNENYIPAIITASVALLAAVLAQIIGHILNKRREDFKNNMNVYQNFIAPIVTDVILYYDAETSFRRGHDYVKEVDLNKIIKKIKKIDDKKQYGDVSLLSSFFDLSILRHTYDARGESEERVKIYLLFWYLEHARSTLQKLSFSKKSEINLKIIQHQKLYGIWYLIWDMFGKEIALDFMQYDFLYYKLVEEQISISDLKKMIVKRNNDNIRLREELIKWIIDFVNFNQEQSHEILIFKELRKKLTYSAN